MRIFSGCLASVFGSIVGAFILNLIFAGIYKMIFPGPVTNSYECSRGSFYGWLSILVGGLLGGFLVGYATYKLSDNRVQE